MADRRKPVVLVIYADTGQHLHFLEDEAAAIAAHLDSSGLCEVRQLPAANLVEVLDALNKRGDYDRIAIVHFAGHANGEGLALKSEAVGVESEVVHMRGLAKNLKHLPNLQLVFLNGCLTNDQVLELTRAGIRLAITTNKGIDDKVARDFADRFYRTLSQMRSIREAFDVAHGDIEGRVGDNTRSLYIGEFQHSAEAQQNVVPWELHGPNKDRAWTLGDPSTADDSLSAHKEAPTSELSLTPIDFSHFLQERRRRFIGRGWLFERIEDWRLNHGDGALLITGDPGTGKSAVVAELVHRQFGAQVLAYHCCRHDEPSTLQLPEMVTSMAAMLARHMPAYAQTWKHEEVEHALREEACREHPLRAFEHGILNPLNSIAPPENTPCYLVIDALDESLAYSKNDFSIVQALASRLQMQMFPDWLRVVATSRNDPEVLDRLEGLRAWKIAADANENLEDVATYIEQRLRQSPLSEQLGKVGKDFEEVTQTLSLKSAGNFLYAKQSLDGLASGLYSLEQLEQLPPGLSGMYLSFFERLFEDQGKYRQGPRKLLQVIVAAKEPLSKKQLAAATGLDVDDELPQLLGRLAPFVPERAGEAEKPHFTIYHKSFEDWLTADRNRKYRANPTRGHEQLAEWCWQEWHQSGKDLSGYALRHLPRHLVEVERWDDLVELLTDLGYLDAKGTSSPVSTVHDLLNDFHVASQTVPADHALRPSLELVWRAIDQHAHILRSFPNLLVQQLANARDWRGTPLEGQLREIEKDPERVWLRLLNRPTEPSTPLIRSILCLGISTHLTFLSDDVLVGASEYANIIGWEVGTGRALWHLKHTRGFAATSPDQRLLATIYPTHVWNLEIGQIVLELERDATSLAFSPDSCSIALACIGELVVCDALTGRVAWSTAVDVRAVAYDSAGRRLVGIGAELWLWNADEGSLLLHLGEWPDGGLGAVAFGKEVLAVAVGDNIELRDAATGDRLQLLQGHLRQVTTVAFSPNGEILASGGRDRSVLIWNVATGKLLNTLRGHNRPVESVAFSPNGQVLASSEGHTGPVQVGSALPESEIRLWDVGLSHFTSEVEQQGTNQVCAYHPARQLLASRDEAGIVRVWKKDVERPLYTSDAYPQNAGPLVFSPDGEILASGGEDRSLLLWEIATNRLRQFSTRPDPWLGSTDFNPWMFAVALSPDGSRVAAGGGIAGVVRVWEIESGRLKWAKGPEDGFVCAIAIDMDSRVLASGHASGKVRLWDLVSGDTLFELEGPHKSVSEAVFHPDGRILATGGGTTDRRVCLWDLDSGSLLRSFQAQHGVSALAFSPDGRTLASGHDQWVRLWDPDTGAELARFRCGSYVHGVWFDPSAPCLFVADGIRRVLPNLCRLEIVGRQ